MEGTFPNRRGGETHRGGFFVSGLRVEGKFDTIDNMSFVISEFSDSLK